MNVSFVLVSKIQSKNFLTFRFYTYLPQPYKYAFRIFLFFNQCPQNSAYNVYYFNTVTLEI